MKRLLIQFLSLALLTLLPRGNVAADNFALGDRETIVFAGDSITNGGLYVAYVEGYLLTRFPERSIRIINSGKSSETVSGLCEADHPNNRRPCLFERFPEAVAAYAPTYVVACYGINDGIYHPFGQDRFEKYQAGVARLVKLVTGEAHARLLLLTPPVYDSANPGQPDVRPAASYGYKKPFADYDQVMARYAAWLATLNEQNVTVANLHMRMRTYLDAMRHVDPDFRMSKDGIHPGPDGHLVMALAVLKAWNAPALVDDVRINAATRQAGGGKVSGLKVTGGTVEFTWTSRVPMPSDANWTSRTLDLIQFRRELDRYRMTVRGLPEGQYTLSADGVAVASFPAKSLGQGIDLTRLEKLPTTARAGRIVPLLFERRKLGYAPYVKGAPAAADPKREELEKKIHDLCAPMTMKIRIAPAGKQEKSAERGRRSAEKKTGGRRN